MIDKKLAVIHSIEDFNLCVWMYSPQMPDLRFSNEGFLCPVPEVYVLS